MRLLRLVLLVGLAGSLVGCGSKEDDSASKDTEKTGAGLQAAKKPGEKDPPDKPKTRPTVEPPVVKPDAVSEWPCYRADAAGTGVTTEELRLPLVLSWSYTPSQQPEPAWPAPGIRSPTTKLANFTFDYAPQPVMAEGLVYFGSSADDTLRALDVNTGQTRWRFTMSGPIRFAPTISAGKVYVASDDGRLYCLDAKTGKQHWQFRGGLNDRQVLGNGRMISRWPLRSGVAVEKGVAYFTAGMWPSEGVFVYALDAQSGKVLWCNDTSHAMYSKQPHSGSYAFTGIAPQGYLYTSGQSLMVPQGRQPPARYTRATGRLDELYITPWIDARKSFASPSKDGPSFTITSAVGAYMGTNTVKSSSGTFYCLVASGKTVLAGGDKSISAHTAGKEVWRNDQLQGAVYGIAVANGHVVATTTNGMICCFRQQGQAAGATKEPVAISGRRGPPSFPRSAAAQDMLELIGKHRITKGYALVIGGMKERLAERLAAQTALRVINVLTNDKDVSLERERLLTTTDLYGTRLTVQSLEDATRFPYPPSFANVAVVADEKGFPAEDLYRVLRPCGGVMCFPGLSRSKAESIARTARDDERRDSGKSLVVVRGKLPGAFDWDSTVTRDKLVKWPLELSWFGGPGVARNAFSLPRAANGRYFILASYDVIAMDAYNGTELWSTHLGGTGVYRGALNSLAADDEHVYLNVGALCYQLDAQTGKLKKTYGQKKPKHYSLVEAQSFKIGKGDNPLGRVTLKQTPDGLELALTARDAWTLFFDFRPLSRRNQPYGESGLSHYGEPGIFKGVISSRNATWTPKDGTQCPEMQVTNVVAESGNRTSVKLSWREIEKLIGAKPETFSFTARLTIPGRRRPQIFELSTDKHSDFRNNGWPVFSLGRETSVRPSPKARGVESCSLDDLPEIARKWARIPAPRKQNKNENSGYSLLSSPLTGGDRTQAYAKAHGCARPISSEAMDFFRSGTIGYYDFEDDSGIRNFGGVRPSCGGSMMPALGLLISNEGSGGCRCPYNFQCSLALAPATSRRNEDWARFYDDTPLGASLQRMALNMGAPGDRRDDNGTLWLGFPAKIKISSRWRPVRELVFQEALYRNRHTLIAPFHLEFEQGFGSYRFDSDRTTVDGTKRPWIYASGCRGVKRITLDLAMYNEERSSVSYLCQRPPKIDGMLLDPCWGEGGRLNLGDDTAIYMRHDDKNLYAGFRKRLSRDRRGEVRAWKAATQGKDAPVWDDDCFEMFLSDGDDVMVHLGVSASGASYDAWWTSTPFIPRVQKIEIDGDPTDWGKRGFQTDMFGKGAYRLSWNDKGLLLAVRLSKDFKGPTYGKSPEHDGVQFIVSKPEAADFLELAVDPVAQTYVLNHSLSKDVTPSSVTVAERKSADGYELEALFPWEMLKLDPSTDKEVVFTTMLYRRDKFKAEVEKGKDSRNQILKSLRNQILKNFRSRGVVSRLRLGTVPSAPAKLNPNRDYLTQLMKSRKFKYHLNIPNGIGGFLPTDLCLQEDSRWNGAWRHATHTEDDVFTAEVAVPWEVFEEFDIDRDRLKINFRKEKRLSENASPVWPTFNSGAHSVHRLAPKLRNHTVRLHFSEPDDVPPGRRVFDVKLQGKVVLGDLDIVKAAGGKNKAFTREFKGIQAEKALVIDLVPKNGNLTEQTAPIISGVEVFSE